MRQAGVEATTVGPPDAEGVEVFAAGGVVWRPRLNDPEDANPSGTGVDVLTVHRPKRADWSLPKGKREDGETDEECALREVEEETGLHCILGPELLATRYIDMRGRLKLVRYWAMTVESGELTANDEVDLFRWVPIDEVYRRLTYPHDVEVVQSLLARAEI